MTIKQLANEIIRQLQPLYDPREAAAVAYLYLRSRLGLQRHELVLYGQEEVAADTLTGLGNEVERLKAGCPVQYVLGETEFYGMTFKVTPAVLIPRPETEELVQLVVQQFHDKPVNVWDIGTGSGCIAVALARMLPRGRFYATDISGEALAVARLNAERNGVGVTFARHDMSDSGRLPFGDERFDVIVSNPPYIPASDRPAMHRNVVDFEPGNALFVPDDDKYWCYRAIALLARETLLPQGHLFVETYHDHHDELSTMFRQHGFSSVQSVRDLNGKQRFLVVGM